MSAASSEAQILAALPPAERAAFLALPPAERRFILTADPRERAYYAQLPVAEQPRFAALPPPLRRAHMRLPPAQRAVAAPLSGEDFAAYLTQPDHPAAQAARARSDALTTRAQQLAQAVLAWLGPWLSETDAASSELALALANSQLRTGVSEADARLRLLQTLLATPPMQKRLLEALEARIGAQRARRAQPILPGLLAESLVQATTPESLIEALTERIDDLTPAPAEPSGKSGPPSTSLRMAMACGMSA